MFCDMRKLFVLSLVVCGLGSVGCGEEPEEPKKEDVVFVIPDDMSEDQDAGEDGTGDLAEDQPTIAAGCDSVGFMPEEVTASRTETSVSMIGAVRARGDFMTFFLGENELQDGDYTFEDENFRTCRVCLAYQEGCGDGGCETTFIATQGSASFSMTQDNASVSLNMVRMAEVELDAQLNSTKVPNGRTHCLIEPLGLSGELKADPCEDAPTIAFSDVSCGPAPLSVRFVAPDAAFDRVDSISWDFGDGQTARGTREVEHTFEVGQWRVEVKIRGEISGNPVTLNTPQLISVH